MNPPTTATLTEPLVQQSAGKPLSFYARIILGALERMTLGCLRLELIASESQAASLPAPAATAQNARNRRTKTH